mmetsp:Transcript_11468/g.24327  ORF Transcript_11468/g.24327 Transcript_11468/m.24327 type:complete len:208 (-) Transcript_11468:629-1252(-)
MGSEHLGLVEYGGLGTSLKAIRMALVDFFDAFTNARVGWEPHVLGQIGVKGIAGHQIVVNLLPSRIAKNPFWIEWKDKTLGNLFGQDCLEVFHIYVLPRDRFEGIGNQEKGIVDFLWGVEVETFRSVSNGSRRLEFQGSVFHDRSGFRISKAVFRCFDEESLGSRLFLNVQPTQGPTVAVGWICLLVIQYFLNAIHRPCHQIFLVTR